MEVALTIAGILSTLALLAWAWVLLGRGWFWRADLRLDPGMADPDLESHWPAVAVIVPARNEADLLPETLPTLLRQDYPGDFHVYLVDDHSTDGTSAVAARVARDAAVPDRLTVLESAALPPGWAGKVWALQQGVRAGGGGDFPLLLLTDADIAHPPNGLRALVSRAERWRLDLVSVMVQLQAATPLERTLVPAFVFFFGKLYPPRWSNDPRKDTAAAAGGCMLVRRRTLECRGGLAQISGAIIDDCALARLLKTTGTTGNGNTWLGLSRHWRSLRDYRGIAGIWDMVTRTGFAQLRFSAWLLAATVLGITFLYVTPWLAALAGLALLAAGQGLPWGVWLLVAGLSAWGIMAGMFVPMLRWYRFSPALALLLPVAAFLYTLMTVDSARRHWRGTGSAWKGRTYRNHAVN